MIKNKILKHIALIGGICAITSVSFTELYAQDTTLQQTPEQFFKTMKYRNVGPNRGGRSLGVAGVPSRKNEYYFGAVGGGLWKTTDGGLTWKPVTDGQIKSSSVGAVAVSPSNPDVVYIGTGESEHRGNIIQGDGVYKSLDSGKTWKNVGLKNTQAISRIRVHPTNPDIAYVAALGHPFDPNEERGVFKTTDGGTTWKKILYKNDRAGAEDLILDPSNPDIIYASIWQVYRTPWKMWGGGGACGLFKSTDGGNTWVELSNKPGMPKLPLGKIGITVSPVNSKRLWAIVEANEGGVYRSDDGGMTWTKTNEERKLRQRAFYYSRIYADPKDVNSVYVLNTGMYRSVDGGVKFVGIKQPHGDNHDLWMDPEEPMRMIESNDGGASVSLNGGKTWTDEDYPTAQLYHITATADFPYQLAGAQQDNSTIVVPSEGWNHIVTKTNSVKPGMGYAYTVGGGESGYIAQDPKNHDIFYAGSYSNVLTRINRITGERREIEPFPRFFMGEAAKDLPERFHWTFPIVFSPIDPTRMYVSSQHIYMTKNDGQTWEKISPDLTYADTSRLGISGGVITNDMSGPEIYGTVYAVAPSYFDVNTIWAGSDDGLIHITRDGGKTWRNITPKGIPKDSRISMIDASRHSAGKAYATIKRYQMGDRAPYVYKTEDYGKTWKKITKGFIADDFVHVVREDIVRPGLLFAGTEHGIYVSFNDGDSWDHLQLNLPDTQVPDLVFTEKDLAIATHGRSMYILDDIAPIREYKPEIAKSDVFLFKPYYAVRKVQNAIFQYYLPKSVDKLKIEILDPSGALVQSFDGESPKAKKAPGTATEEDDSADEERGPVQKNPTMTQGLNTFNWNLRYPGATVFKGLILWSASPKNGPVAPPGMYQVRLIANGKTLTYPFEIKLDPRLQNITVNDINEQFKLAMQIRDETSKANEAVIKIRAVKDKLKTAPVTPENKKITLELNAVEEAIYQVKNQSSQDPLNFPIKLNNKIASLQRVVESGEARPTDDSYTVYKQLTDEINKYLNELDKLMQSPEVKNLNLPPAI